MKHVAVAVLLLMLGACTNPNPKGSNLQPNWSPDQFNGMSFATYERCPEEGPCTKLTVVDGKEKGSVEIDAETGDGKALSYKATDVRAFDGQRYRAELVALMTQSNNEMLREIVPEIANVVSDLAIKALCATTGQGCPSAILGDDVPLQGEDFMAAPLTE